MARLADLSHETHRRIVRMLLPDTDEKDKERTKAISNLSKASIYWGTVVIEAMRGQKKELEQIKTSIHPKDSSRKELRRMVRKMLFRLGRLERNVVEIRVAQLSAQQLLRELKPLAAGLKRRTNILA